MKRLLILTTTAVALILGSMAIQPTLAQPPGGFGCGGGFGRMMGRMSEPTMSNVQTLLRRTDVQKELSLSAKQREQLTEQEEKSREEMRERMMSGFDRSTFSNFRDLSQSEREEKMQEVQTKMQTTMTKFNGEQEEKIAKILSVTQMKRLKELDLQWRGPMSLGDPIVVEKMKLAPERTIKVKTLLGEYRKEQNEMRRSMFSGVVGGGQRPDPQEMQDRMEKMMDEGDKLKKTSGEKILAALSDEEKATWKTLTGKKFTFKKEEQL